MRAGVLTLAKGLRVVAALVIAGASAHAQEVVLRGVVLDTTGAPIPNADVGIVALKRLARTDDSGRFVLADIKAGPVQLSVRRLAFEPRKLEVVAAAGAEPLRITLVRSLALLDGVHITAGEMRRREQVEEFYRRSASGLGTYITRDEIERRASGAPSDLLRTVPGIRFVRTATGGRGARFPTTSISRRDCLPMIWIDGQKAPGLEVDDITLTDIEGLEIYSGPSTTPLQFSQSQGANSCGTIVIWSRPPTRRQR